MDTRTIQTLRLLNAEFYRRNHESFSKTRQSPWEGWERILSHLHTPQLEVLDVACGNMRFATFLEQSLPGASIAYHGVDLCSDLLPESLPGTFQRLDIVQALLDDDLVPSIAAPQADLVVSFGFMHHVPTRQLRERFLRGLLQKARPGGIVAVSFWQFADDPHLRAKAEAATGQALAALAMPPAATGQALATLAMPPAATGQALAALAIQPGSPISLEQGDYLLGWQDTSGAFRYCHSFTDGEIAQLAEATTTPTIAAQAAPSSPAAPSSQGTPAAPAAQAPAAQGTPAAHIIDSFKADGRSSRMNAYLVVQKGQE